MEQKINQLKKIGTILLDRTRKWEEYEIAVKGMHLILQEITGVGGAIKNRNEGYETQLDSGLALSPGYAADCTLDTKRTVKYIQALDEAFKKLSSGYSGTVNVFYAGSGPFAPFALPFLMNYDPAAIKFTIADIHPESLAACKKTIDSFNLAGGINEYVQCDLTNYRHHGKYPLHILITETMHRTLSREPHAMITLNMRDQLIEGGVIVPESVKIEAVLSRIGEEVKYLESKISEEEINQTRYSLGTVFELSKNQKYDFTNNGKMITGPVKDIDFDNENRKLLVLLTKIKLSGSIELLEKESGITHPYFVQEIGNIEKGDKISFSFNLNHYPKMICEKVMKEQNVLEALESL